MNLKTIDIIMDIKLVIFILFFGLINAQENRDVKICILQRKPNDNIEVTIFNNSDKNIKILLDRHLGLNTTSSDENLLYYMFGSFSYSLGTNNNIYRGQQYLSDLNYGILRNLTLKDYILKNTVIIKSKSSLKFEVNFDEISFCKENKVKGKLITDYLKISYFGKDINDYLKKEHIENINPTEYFSENLHSNVLKVKGFVCYTSR